MKQETYVAPASAARSACAAEKTSVMLTRMPSEASSRVARQARLRERHLHDHVTMQPGEGAPFGDHLLGLVGDHLGRHRPVHQLADAHDGLARVARSSLASRVGLVVAPESTPQAAISSTSATDPVSMNSFM